MRKVGIISIVATNLVVSQPPECQPPGTLTACPNIQQTGAKTVSLELGHLVKIQSIL